VALWVFTAPNNVFCIAVTNDIAENYVTLFDGGLYFENYKSQDIIFDLILARRDFAQISLHSVTGI
jgi:hypothetical protein